MANRRYTEEFKAEAVKQVRERGYPVQQVAKRIGVSGKSLYSWVKSSRGDKATGTLDVVRRENIRLKSELKRVEEERDILKKATAYFARESG
jgi:transposase